VSSRQTKNQAPRPLVYPRGLTFLEDGARVRIPSPVGQRRAVPPVVVELVLALLDRLRQSLEGRPRRVGLPEAELHLGPGQSRRRPADGRLGVEVRSEGRLSAVGR
jgi:hypothetical protein